MELKLHDDDRDDDRNNKRTLTISLLLYTCAHARTLTFFCFENFVSSYAFRHVLIWWNDDIMGYLAAIKLLLASGSN